MRAKPVSTLSPRTLDAIKKLGADLALARVRRKESLRSWEARTKINMSSLQRLEAGDPSMSIGMYAVALAHINRDEELGMLAAPELDPGPVKLSIEQGRELHRARADASARGRKTAPKVVAPPSGDRNRESAEKGKLKSPFSMFEGPSKS